MSSSQEENKADAPKVPVPKLDLSKVNPPSPAEPLQTARESQLIAKLREQEAAEAAERKKNEARAAALSKIEAYVSEQDELAADDYKALLACQPEASAQDLDLSIKKLVAEESENMAKAAAAANDDEKMTHLKKAHAARKKLNVTRSLRGNAWNQSASADLPGHDWMVTAAPVLEKDVEAEMVRHPVTAQLGMYAAAIVLDVAEDERSSMKTFLLQKYVEKVYAKDDPAWVEALKELISQLIGYALGRTSKENKTVQKIANTLNEMKAAVDNMGELMETINQRIHKMGSTVLHAARNATYSNVVVATKARDMPGVTRTAATLMAVAEGLETKGLNISQGFPRELGLARRVVEAPSEEKQKLSENSAVANHPAVVRLSTLKLKLASLARRLGTPGAPMYETNALLNVSQVKILRAVSIALPMGSALAAELTKAAALAITGEDQEDAQGAAYYKEQKEKLTDMIESATKPKLAIEDKK